MKLIFDLVWVSENHKYLKIREKGLHIKVIMSQVVNNLKMLPKIDTINIFK